MPPSRRRAAEALRNSSGALSTAATARMSTDLPWFDDLSARGPLLGRADRPGRHPRLRRVVRRRRRGPGPRPPRRGGLRRRAARADRRDLAPADRRAGAAEHPGRGDQHRRAAGPRRTSARSTTRCCSTRARSPSPPPLSTPAPRSRAARGTPASRRSWSTRSCAPRPTRPSSPARAPWAGARTATSPWCWAPCRRTAPSSTSSSPYAARRAPATWTRSAPPRATGWSSSSAGSPIRSRPPTRLLDHFGDGPVVVGPVTADLAHANASARAALSAHRAASGWPDAPRPVASRDLLPERALAGDGHARRHLVDEVYLPLMATRGTLLETLGAWFEHGSSIEGTARALFVHPNTVRYRLRQDRRGHRLVTDPTPRGLRPAAGTDPRPPVRTHRVVGTLQGSGGEFRRASDPRRRRRTRQSGPVLVIVAPGQGAQTPGFLTPWLEDPTFAARFDWLATVAGIDLAHYGTEADAETIRDTKIAQPLLVATGLVAALDLFPHPADAFARDRRRGRPQRRRADRRRRRPRHHRRAGDGAGPRARQRDGRPLPPPPPPA